MWKRVAIGGASALALVLCSVIAAYTRLLSGLGTCDGDGGYPFAARGSVAGYMCNSVVGHVYTWSQLLLPIVLVLALGTSAVVRARWSRLLVGVGVSVAVAVTMSLVLLFLPRQCSEHQQETHDIHYCESY